MTFTTIIFDGDRVAALRALEATRVSIVARGAGCYTAGSYPQPYLAVEDDSWGISQVEAVAADRAEQFGCTIRLE